MLLEMKGFSYRYPGEDCFTVKDVDMAVGPGECHCITGPTGSGKSTLAIAMKGLLPDGETRGEVTAGHCTGLVLQNPETQLLCHTVGAEAAFGLENQCVPPSLMAGRVCDALDMAGLHKPLDYEGGRLSMGQKYRLIMASQLVMGHRLMVLDEPAAQLDQEGIERLAGTISRLKGLGVSFVLCEHDAGPLSGVIDRYWALGHDGTLAPAKRPAPVIPAASPVAATRTGGPGDMTVSAKGLSVGFGTSGSHVWSNATFELYRGQNVVVRGENGSGKTTLLRCMAGLIKPSGGELIVCGEDPADTRLTGRVALMLQDPSAQLFEDTVRDEVSFTLWRMGFRGARLDGRVDGTLSACGITGLATASPHKLSYGQKRLVALASVLAPRPELLLLDDPFAGLDPVLRMKIGGVIAAQSRLHGMTVVRTSHDTRGAEPNTDTIVINGGRVEPEYS